MITVLIVGRQNRWREQIASAVPQASVFMAADEAEALRHVRRIETDIVVWADAGTKRASEAFFAMAKEAAPACVTVAVSDDMDDAIDVVDFVLREADPSQRTESTIHRAVEQHRLLREVAASRTRHPTPTPPTDPPAAEIAAFSGRVLKEFTRIFAAGFDLRQTLETFMDAVVELLRPARLALLMPEPDGRAYRVRVHRGLAPQIAESVRLPADSGLCHWLTIEGRPARGGDIDDVQVARELALLQGAMAVPLLARGELVAVLVVGTPVVRNAYAAHEVETLFDLATHLASAIDGITLHHRLKQASEFNERILDHMSSGVVTIGADERVGTLNRRGAEILEMDPHAVVGHDLRVLPSPLGDMLYETLTTGRARPRAEIRLARRGLWLEVSTYPVRGEDVTYAVLVFEDLTAQKELAAQKQQAEQFELLTRVVARIADEIKNPLVSINTFMELIGERFDDPEFRRHFSSVVGRDVRRLVQVFEKLTGLVSQGELSFSSVDVQDVVDEVVATIQAADEASRKPIDIHVSRDTAPVRVKVDPGQLRKALAYLVWYFGYHSPDRAAVSIAVGRRTEGDGPETARVIIGSRTAVIAPPDLERLFDPVRMVQESLIDIGPAVSQRLVEALGGRLEVRHGKHDVAFVMRLPAAI